MMLLMPALLMAQPECGLGLLDRLYPGMKRMELDSVMRSEPCVFAHPSRSSEYAHITDYARQGIESLPDPSAFRLDLVESRTDGDRDTNDVHVIILKGRRLGRDRADLVPLHMRSLLDTLIARFGPPTYSYPDDFIAAAPAAIMDGDETRSYGELYARWTFFHQKLFVQLMRSYNGWQIEVRLEESDPQPKG
jgi:hypothetical protein